ncbi:hypothetical protein UlMin_007195 [Ulmus minor]
MAYYNNPLVRFWIFLHVIFILVSSSSLAPLDYEILLQFKDSLEDAEALIPTWNTSTPPCSADKANWRGVLCDKDGEISGLKIENMGLKGFIDVDSLKNLPNLRTLSFMKNNFEGPFPDLGQLGALKSVYLSNNKFSGEIPSDVFLRMLSLKKLFLAHNQFTGSLPASLELLPKLIVLRVEGNQFQGRIPNFPQKTWLSFNVSNNILEGRVPHSLSTMDATSFHGNEDLCGLPLKACATKKPSLWSIVVVVIVVVMALAAIGAVILILSRCKQNPTLTENPSTLPPPPTTKTGNTTTTTAVEKQDEYHHHQAGNTSRCSSPGRGSSSSSSYTSSKKGAESLKLTFVRDDREKFDMHDLLKASAEILGSGCFGSSYKAALLSGSTMVVKRYKQMNNVGRDEFQEHMRRLGRLRHPNVLPLVAYYYKKEEKLLISDYFRNGSLAVHLHGRHAQGQTSLDWPKRLKIIKGVAKGLQYLQNELPTLIAAHGHLKSSNVLLNESYEPLLSDYALIPVINQEHAQQLMVAYKSPEHSRHGRITKKTDVWSLGVLILEILTGKFPANFLQQGKGSEEQDLANWVSSIPEEEWKSDKVFDKEMLKKSEGEMKKLLRIGMSCCEGDVEKRLDIREAVEKIEELREKTTHDHHRPSSTNLDEDFYSSCASDLDLRPSSDFISFTIKD